MQVNFYPYTKWDGKRFSHAKSFEIVFSHTEGVGGGGGKKMCTL